VTNATSSANAAKAAETEAVAALAKLKALSDETKKASLAANQQLIRLRAQSGVPSAASASTKKVASEKMLAALSAQLDAARQDLAQLPKQPTPPTRDAKAATVAGAQCGAELKFETASSAADRKLVAAAYADALTDSGNEVTIAKVDLNGDGILDGIISVRGQDWCGTAGCSMSVQVSRDGRFVRALDVTTEDLAVAKTNTGGFCDLILEGSVTWKWTGKSYEVKR